MLSPQEFASQVDGVVIEAEIDRLSSLHSADAVETATRLSRRINRTVEWNPLGPEGARFRLMTSRGEAVVFWDDADAGERVIKLRGREENGNDVRLQLSDKRQLRLLPLQLHSGFSEQVFGGGMGQMENHAASRRERKWFMKAS
jgi:hypothetical protein